MFAVFDRYGDVEALARGEEGIFYDGTRFLSDFALFIGNSRPLLLSSTIRYDNSLFSADLTNVDITQDDEVVIPRGTLLVSRSKFLYECSCYEQLRIANFGRNAIKIPFGLKFDADYADIFEVRGTKREHRGQRLEPQTSRDGTILSYRGLDGKVRFTKLQCTPSPRRTSSNDFRIDVALAPKQDVTYQLIVSCYYHPSTDGVPTYHKALATAQQNSEETIQDSCSIHSSNEQFNGWLRRSVSDIQMMIVGNPEVGYPYAGVPWFSTVFGRDGIITALECLWVLPSFAQGVLSYLAQTQATAEIPEQDAEPGKILHEMRRGEMAATKEVPFARYYGSVDSTPLFVVLAGAYLDRTNDLSFVSAIWPNVKAALRWMDIYGDCDNDGFIEYAKRSTRGLIQQGWKDSHDSVFHADGSMAEPPIALCEVQAYAYAAKCAGARLARALGERELGQRLEREAQSLRLAFEQAFW